MCTGKAAACTGKASQAGLSLIELIMFIVIVGVALAGVLLVMNQNLKHSADPLIRKQSLAIAESLLEEIELMPFTFCDPDDANAANATAATPAQCPAAGGAGGVENIGPETGETRYSAATPFDNVNDYHGFTMSGINDITNTAVSGLGAYTARADIVQEALPGIPAAEVVRITVTVTGPDNLPLTLQGYRARYAPNAVP